MQETVPFGICEHDEVRIGRIAVPVDRLGAEGYEAPALQRPVLRRRQHAGPDEYTGGPEG